MADRPKYYFAPLPHRAFGDRELSGADWSTLAAVSYFDRFSSNGMGCYVGRKRIAEVTQLTEQTVSASLRKLESRGYIQVTEGRDRRRRQYHIVHDTTKLGNETATYSGGDTSPSADLSSENRSPTGNKIGRRSPSPNPPPAQSCRGFQGTEDRREDIPRSGGEDIPQSCLRAEGKKISRGQRAAAARLSPTEQEGAANGVDIDRVVELYNEILPELPTANLSTEEMARNLADLQKERPKAAAEDWWRSYFRAVKRCPYLLGQRTRFIANLGWLVRPDSMAKVINGDYLDGDGGEPRPPARRELGEALSIAEGYFPGAI